ncbi:MAG: hypothetical protein HY908_13265 [Myxococcales bacterium]|nr:hypothetical protein [Myxococcales bacterium]
MSELFRGVCARERERLNALFRAHGRGVEPAVALELLRRTVAPVVDALGAPAASEAPAVATALFEVALRGQTRGLFGAHSAGAFETALVAALPGFGPALVRAPLRLLGALGNGWARLERELGPDTATRWLDAWSAVAPSCTASDEALYGAGLVLAWRFGLAEARDKALARAAALGPELCEALTGSSELDPAPERRFAPPGSRARLGPPAVVARVGGFVGFGGPFARPPDVYGLGARLYATDGDVVRELFADVFGARLVPTPLGCEALLEGASEAQVLTVNAAGVVDWDGARVTLPALRDAKSGASSPGLAAVALATSHAVFVLGRRAEGA